MNSDSDKTVSYHETYDPNYFRMIADVERRHFWFQTRNAMVGELVKQTVANMTGDYRVLEVGCGTGALLAILEHVCKGGTVTGMDLYPEALEFARLRTSCALELGDIREVNFKERFDLICMCDVLEHLPDDNIALRRLREMILPGGALILTVPAFPSLWSYFDNVAHHYRRYTLSMLRQKLHDAGFAIEYISCFMCILLPVAYVVRSLRGMCRRMRGDVARNGGNELVRNELKVNPAINWIFGMLFRLDNKLIRNRITLRFGTSIVAMVRRNG